MIASQFAAMNLEIDIKTGTLFSIGSFHVTNSMVTGTVSLIIFFLLFLYFARSVKQGKYNRFIGLFSWAFEGMLAQVDDVIPDKKIARKIAPVALTIFFYMLISYWMSILPGLETIKYNHVPILRSIAADLNFTLAVTLVVFVIVQFYALKVHGFFGNAKRYLKNPFKDPIGAFEGALEFIGEFSRYAALAVRMFGNCFAGEILLIILTVLTGYFSMLALPLFMAFEVLIGFVQAYVFFILAVIFTSLAIDTTAHGNSHEHSSASTKELAQQE